MRIIRDLLHQRDGPARHVRRHEIRFWNRNAKNDDNRGTESDPEKRARRSLKTAAKTLSLHRSNSPCTRRATANIIAREMRKADESESKQPDARMTSNWPEAQLQLMDGKARSPRMYEFPSQTEEDSREVHHANAPSPTSSIGEARALSESGRKSSSQLEIQNLGDRLIELRLNNDTIAENTSLDPFAVPFSTKQRDNITNKCHKGIINLHEIKNVAWQSVTDERLRQCRPEFAKQRPFDANQPPQVPNPYALGFSQTHTQAYTPLSLQPPTANSGPAERPVNREHHDERAIRTKRTETKTRRTDRESPSSVQALKQKFERLASDGSSSAGSSAGNSFRSSRYELQVADLQKRVESLEATKVVAAEKIEDTQNRFPAPPQSPPRARPIKSGQPGLDQDSLSAKIRNCQYNGFPPAHRERTHREEPRHAQTRTHVNANHNDEARSFAVFSAESGEDSDFVSELAYNAELSRRELERRASARKVGAGQTHSPRANESRAYGSDGLNKYMLSHRYDEHARRSSRQEPMWQPPYGGAGRYPPDDDPDSDPSDGNDWYKRTPDPMYRSGVPTGGNAMNREIGHYGLRMPFHQAAACIPDFHGDPDTLNLFRTAVREVMLSHGPAYERYLLLFIANKLKGKATENYRARIANYTSVEKLLHDLTLHYANIGVADQIYTQLRSIKQGTSEPVGDYGLRVEKLFNRFMTIVDTAPDLSSSDRRARRRQARGDVLDQFLFGLKAPLDHQLRCRFPRDLSAAISAAIEFEGKQSGRDAGNVQSFPGKPTAQVRRVVAEETGPGQSERHGTNSGKSEDTQPDQEVNPRAHCIYCNRHGHSVDECKELVRHASRQVISNPYQKNNKSGSNNNNANNGANNNNKNPNNGNGGNINANKGGSNGGNGKNNKKRGGTNRNNRDKNKRDRSSDGNDRSSDREDQNTGNLNE